MVYIALRVKKRDVSVEKRRNKRKEMSVETGPQKTFSMLYALRSPLSAQPQPHMLISDCSMENLSSKMTEKTKSFHC